MWGAVTPGPGRLVFPRAWQSCFFGVLVPGWLLWDDARSRVLGGTGRARGSSPCGGHGAGEALPGWPRFGAERRRRRRMEGGHRVWLR